MAKEDVLKDIQSFMEDIDKCTGKVIMAMEMEKLDYLSKAYNEMERLMVAAHQELSFLYDYIKDYEDKFTDLAEHWLHIQFNLEKMECSDIEKFVKQFKDYIKEGGKDA